MRPRWRGASHRTRAEAAQGWGRAAAVAGRCADAVEGLATAVGLLGRAVPRGLARGDQEHVLAELTRLLGREQGDLASDAVACCVHAVAMPHTPDERDIPGAETEAAGLEQCLGARVRVLTGPEATREAVLAALPEARWAHFACHGAADMRNPSASRLLLADHQDRPLTVMDVTKQRLDDAELAFLSACSTAQPMGPLPDEAIHLASAFQLAGYRHVVGTLWPIGDQHAVDIAADIYATLAGSGTGTIDVAGAVHAATRRMRKRWGWDRPSVWASHIHSGA